VTVILMLTGIYFLNDESFVQDFLVVLCKYYVHSVYILHNIILQ